MCFDRLALPVLLVPRAAVLERLLGWVSYGAALLSCVHRVRITGSSESGNIVCCCETDTLSHAPAGVVGLMAVLCKAGCAHTVQLVPPAVSDRPQRLSTAAVGAVAAVGGSAHLHRRLPHLQIFVT